LRIVPCKIAVNMSGIDRLNYRWALFL